MSIETSMGIAISDTSLSTTSGLLRAADVALYRAKAMGRGIEVLYEPEMLEESIRRFDLEADLHHALAENQFTVFYQPIVQLAADRTIAVESSLRWNRPGHGTLEPAGFRDVAEEIGLLAELEAWMLTQAIRQLAEWRSTGLISLDEFQLQVGLTRRPRDLATLVHLAERLTREWNIDPRHVCFDLHPRIEWSSDAEREAFFAEVRRIGIGVAVTVYADGNDPLFYLRRQYADILRIDPAFLAEHGELETDSEIVAAIAGLARRLGAKSMALGIDSSHRHLVAREIGVPYGQGDYFGAAEPAAAMTARLARTRPPDGSVRV